MKNIQSFNEFINEGLNEAMSFDDAVKQFTENPYGIGASRVHVVGDEEHHVKGHRVLKFAHENAFDRDKTMAKLKTLGFSAKNMTKNMTDKGYMFRYYVNLFEGAVNEDSIDEAAKWPLTDKIDSKTFYDMWASLDVASQNLSDYMDEANKGKEKDALFSLKVAYDELSDLMKSKTIEKQLKSIAEELKDKNVLR
jgi:hypothetical protein